MTELGIHFGKIAKVVGCHPDNDDTIDVQLVDDTQVIRQWPRYLLSSLTTILGDDHIWRHILSFLGQGTGSSARSAFRFHCQVAQVCQRWKRIADDNLPSIVGPMHVDLVPTMGCWQLMNPIVKWINRHDFQIRSLRISDSPRLAATVMDLLEKKHKTRDLRKVELVYTARQGRPPRQGRTEDNDDITDATTSMKQLEEAIVNKCDNIETLSVRFLDGFFSRGYNQSPNPAFFQLGITRLELICDNEYSIDPWLQLVEKLPCLRELTIRFRRFHTLQRHLGLPIGGLNAMMIKSETLVSIDVSTLDVWTFCDCPQLERFRSSRSLPEDLSEQQFNQIRLLGNLEVLAESMPFLGISVPPSCHLETAVLNLFMGYDEYSERLNTLRNMYFEE
ncbi:expressed unknown protein [Seminavis robusta]|uniref:F-box domain-containing protein n=1 Tax=Seminavis robusta TaxID=568900 RepID=A0A9N8ER95_9STRA|nr:expressed unknown protein [Seminavis robusta]|eukprot:Sro1465_g274960.1 n/a (391) ;mRNA; r:4063-5235